MPDKRKGASLVSFLGERTAEFISSSRCSDLLLKSPPSLLSNRLSLEEGGCISLSYFNKAALPCPQQQLAEKNGKKSGAGERGTDAWL